MNKFKELQNKHLALLEKSREGQSSGELVQEVEAYIEEVKIAGKDIPSSQQRDQLRANLRFWGAFIYERKKVFPDINLWPSTKKSPAGQGRGGRGLLLAAGILGGVILVIIAGLAIFNLLISRISSQEIPSTSDASDPNSIFTAPALTVSAIDTQSAVSSIPSPLPAQNNAAQYFGLPTGTPPIPEATLTPEAAVTAVSSPTPNPSTATISVGLAQVAAATQTVINTSTAIPEPMGFIPIPKYSSGCEDKKRDISIQWTATQFNDSGATAYLSGPDKDIQEKVEVISNGDAAVISLSGSGTSQSYFLQIVHPQFLFEPIIVQFTSECAYDHMSITYSDNTYPVAQSIQDINLALVDWGPTSLSDSSPWIAELSIKHDDGGIYLYGGSPIREETIFVNGWGCSSPPLTIGRTNNGQLQEATFSLHMAGPLCPHSIR